MIKYMVFDECTKNASPLYLTIEQANLDLYNNISFEWSLDANVIEVYVEERK